MRYEVSYTPEAAFRPMQPDQVKCCPPVMTIKNLFPAVFRSNEFLGLIYVV